MSKRIYPGVKESFLCASLLTLTSYIFAQPLTHSFLYKPNVFITNASLASNPQGEVLVMANDTIHAYLTKVGTDGKLAWSFAMDSMGNQMRAINAGKQNWLVYGSSAYAGSQDRSDYELHMIDEAGKVKWSTRFGGARDERPLSLHLLDSQRAIMAGNSFGTGEDMQQEAIIISLDNGSIIKQASLVSAQPMSANAAVYVNGQLYFWGFTLSPAIETPILASIDSALVKVDAFRFLDQIGKNGTALSENGNGGLALAISRTGGSEDAILVSFNKPEEAVLSGQHFSFPGHSFQVGQMLRQPTGYQISGSLATAGLSKEALLSSLSDDFRPIASFRDSSLRKQPVSSICSIPAVGYSYLRRAKAYGTPAENDETVGISLQEIRSIGTPFCPLESFSFNTTDTSVKASQVGASLVPNVSFSVDSPEVSQRPSTFLRTSYCEGSRPFSDFAFADTTACSAEGILINDSSTGATSQRWYYTNALVDSFIGFNPPPVFAKGAGILKATQIVESVDGADTSSYEIRVIRSPSLKLPVDTYLCLGDTLKLEAKGFIEDSYQWSPGNVVSPDTARLTLFHPVQSTTYKVLAANRGRCAVSDSFFMRVHKPVELSLSQNTDSLCQGDTAQLSLIPGPYNILWGDGDTAAAIKAIESGPYQVSISNRCFNASGEFMLFDKKICPGAYFIPTAFSPNNDGENDTWKPYIAYLRNMEFWIYSRWGQLVFYQKSATPEWKGQLKSGEAPAGQYYFVARLNWLDGKKEDLEGRITLIR